jgi:hypothetical protein
MLICKKMDSLGRKNVMKNKNTTTLALIILTAAVLGCSSINPFKDKSKGEQKSTDKTVTDKTIDSSIDGERIGIPECDAIIDDLAAETVSKDEGYIVKAFRAYYVSKIREAIKKSVEENKNDPAKLAVECKKIKDQLDKYKAEEEEKKK